MSPTENVDVDAHSEEILSWSETDEILGEPTHSEESYVILFFYLFLFPSVLLIYHTVRMKWQLSTMQI